MRWHDIYVSASAASLGQKEETGVAVAEGRYDALENEANGYLAVRVADDSPAIEMAVRAAALALDRSGVPAAQVRLIVHASVAHQGLDHFAPASYIQSRAVGGDAMAVEVKQFSNGGLASLEIASAYLMAAPAPSSALLTTSDKFVPPVFDRYRCDRGIVFGDGGTALVLSRGSGVARVLSTSVISDGTFGAVSMGDGQWGGGPAAGAAPGRPVDMRKRREQYLADNAELLLRVVESLTVRQRHNVGIALADAGLSGDDVDRWVFSNDGQTQVDWEFRKALGIEESRTTWEWGRQVGHLGAGDQFAGLAYLLETGAVGAGDVVALCGMGMGFSYGCAIVRILRQPQWPVSAA